jgi:zinc-finger of acetyl-transferase ESCO
MAPVITSRAEARIPPLRRQTGHCLLCRFLYDPEYEEDRKLHRKRHAAMVAVRFPRPDPRLAAFGGGDVRVDRDSPRWLNNLVYDRARALAQDEGYDFPPWTKDTPPEDDYRYRDDTHAWLLIEEGSIPVGVTTFTWMKWQNIPPCWVMNIAWVANEWRRKGVMTRRWDGWRTAYGDFHLDRPLSVAMEAFARKIGHRGPQPYASGDAA